MHITPHSSAIRSLMYDMVCNIHGLAHTINMKSGFTCYPRKAHWKVVKWIIQYLEGTNISRVHGGSIYSGGLLGFIDSDHNNDLLKRR